MRTVVNAGYLPFGPDLDHAQVANFGFDAFAYETWGSLLHGARLVIVPREVVLDPARFVELLGRERIGAMLLTAAYFNQVVALSPSALRNVGYVLTGGDVLDPAAVRRVLDAQPPGKLINTCGPTEALVLAVSHEVEPADAQAPRIPIGRPIANTRVYVLDQNRVPVPVGVPGELYIGGPGVALSYLNQPELTSEKFIRDPFTSKPPGVLYKTGDLVKWRADGVLEFLKRIDFQVKIRGFRIELGEVQVALQAHPAVQDAVVLVREERPGDKRLVAYVTARPGAALERSELRAFLGKALPEFMVPGDILVLEAFPLTPNGKVDRRALPAPSYDDRRETAEPQTPLEVQIAALWGELLGVPAPGRHDNFFEFGGNSLLAITLLSRLSELTGTPVPTRIFYEKPTIALLGEALASGEISASPARYVTVRRDGMKSPFFLLHGYFNGGLYAINLSRHLGTDRAFYALHPHASDGVDEPVPASIEAMADDHYAQIRALQPHGPYALGGFCNGAYVAFEVARRLRAMDETVALLAILSTRAPRRSHLLRRAVGAAARLRGRSSQDELRSYLHWRDFTDRISSPRRAFSHVLRRCTPDGRVSATNASAPEAIATGEEIDARGFSYIDTVSRYVPGRFDGTVTLVYAEEAYAGQGDPHAGWGHFADHVELHLVPGGANSSLTNHPEAVAAVLREALERE